MTLLGSEHSLLIRSKFRSVVQLRLQQRRTREQLADQGIMPPLKSPAAFHEQKKSLERSKTEDYLKHKIRNRPERADLVNMHILQDSAAEGPQQATQMKLKRSRLAVDLNEKIALRPGPLELVKKNIIPVDSSVKEVAMKVNHGKFPKEEDTYAFEEESSSDGLSPEHGRGDESQGPTEIKTAEVPSPTPLGASQISLSQEANVQNVFYGNHIRETESPRQITTAHTPPIPVPAINKSKTLDKNRHKKPKDTKPKVKKLKYHQYIPPDQKAEKTPPPMDSAYARLLQQQQLFLQLQILSQQKHHQHSHQHQQHFSYQTASPPQLKQHNEPLSRSPNVGIGASSTTSPVKNSFTGQTCISPVKTGPLPSNLDDLKVSELRQQLRIRGLPVSGTKTALVERLRPFQDPSANNGMPLGDIKTITFPVTPASSMTGYQGSSGTPSNGFYQFSSTSSSPPISPASSDLSVSGSLPDSFSDVTLSSPPMCLQPSPGHLSAEEGLMGNMNGGCMQAELEGLDAEKDKMLVEKQKVIDELTWKLHQEQRQVEELKMQLHKRKRNHSQQQEEVVTSPFFGVSIKQEHVVSSCPLSNKHVKTVSSCQPSHLPGMVSPLCLDATSGSPALSAFLSPQCSPQHSPLNKTASSPQHSSLPPSPSNPYFLSVSPSGQIGDGNNHSPHRPLQISQSTSGHSGSSTCSYPTDQRNIQPPFANTNNRGHPVTKSQSIHHKMAILHSPGHGGQKFPFSSAAFCSSDSTASKIKQPPSYEDAVKQQLTRSQQMDELLDVLIASGEMPANAKEEQSCPPKMVPQITVSSGNSKLLRTYEHMPSSQAPFEPGTNNGSSRLDTLLSTSISRASEIVLLKLGEEGGVGEEFLVARQEELLGTPEMMDTPLSPMSVRISPTSSTESQALALSFSESPWEAMEWLDLTPPSSATSFVSLPTSGPSIFNAEFLDVTDLSLNTAMDLHLEQW
ncbi:myocardin isoform X3 [Erpetoichthys calabaricus]|uniref:myocardin isoform X3 n=1 Tax=Erpetoichthys calabaricus TaxID=27687 RepID=UPI00109F467E|nr:myocardin isoform X3 [Erpetoichthys calabaricus]